MFDIYGIDDRQRQMQRANQFSMQNNGGRQLAADYGMEENKQQQNGSQNIMGGQNSANGLGVLGAALGALANGGNVGEAMANFANQRNGFVTGGDGGYGLGALIGMGMKKANDGNYGYVKNDQGENVAINLYKPQDYKGSDKQYWNEQTPEQQQKLRDMALDPKLRPQQPMMNNQMANNQMPNNLQNQQFDVSQLSPDQRMKLWAQLEGWKNNMTMR